MVARSVDYKKVVELYKKGISYKKIASQLNICESSVSFALRESGIKFNRIRIFSKKQEKKIICLYKNPGTKLKTICKMFNIRPGAIYKICKKYGLYKRLKLNRSKLNHNYFSKINSEEKAYWLGFLMADGCIDDRNRVVLLIKDRSQILKLIKSLKLKSKIYIVKRTNKDGIVSKCFRIEFISKIMCKDLKRYGLVQRKTTKEIFPKKYIPNNLIVHFWRGVIDGDGWVSRARWMIKQKSKYPFEIGLCGGKRIVKSFMVWCKKLIKTNANMRKQKKCNCYTFHFAGKSAANIISKIYRNSHIYLNRKYRSAKHAINLRKYSK